MTNAGVAQRQSLSTVSCGPPSADAERTAQGDLAGLSLRRATGNRSCLSASTGSAPCTRTRWQRTTSVDLRHVLFCTPRHVRTLTSCGVGRETALVFPVGGGYCVALSALGAQIRGA
uniref:Uncharacterized protein n=1 Tax=Paenarthrobacter nicotinovorans TaxID=29320 RepID=Q8GAM0_PAENI|nr:hypothetical protein [Paenarthrobacter nicotinovorans]